MRAHILFCLVSTAACSDPPKTTPDAAAPEPDADTAPTIAITSEAPLLLVVFRDGVDAPWQAATMLSSMRYEARVHGPYLVEAVAGSGVYTTTLYARTLDDDHTITVGASAATPTSSVTGTMVSAGSVAMDKRSEQNTQTNWSFQLAVSPGPHDLWAFSADHALVRRAVDATHDVAIGTLDVNAHGTALATVPFTVTNKTAAEQLSAAAQIQSATTSAPGPATTDPSTTKIVPDSLLASTDHQVVGLSGRAGSHVRGIAKPYRAGDSTAYTLPTLVSNLTWTAASDLEVQWTAPPATTQLALTASATNAQYSYVATASFLDATHRDRIVFDTTPPGYQAAWRLDPTQSYRRTVTAVRTTADALELEIDFDAPLN